MNPYFYVEYMGFQCVFPPPLKSLSSIFPFYQITCNTKQFAVHAFSSFEIQAAVLDYAIPNFKHFHYKLTPSCHFLFEGIGFLVKFLNKMTALGNQTLNLYKSSVLNFPEAKSPPSRAAGRSKKPGICARSTFVAPIKAMEASEATKSANAQSPHCKGKNGPKMSTVGNSSNIVWHKCSVEKSDREELLNQKGCVIWITGLSGSGKSTLACALSRSLHARGKLTYILDGDNCRHGLNRDLSFKAEDRSENIRRIGEVAKLFADAGVICIASLISPFRKERDACRNLLSEGDFIEVYMDVPLQVCETRDPKGLYKLARAGKIKGFTGVDDPYEPPLNSEIVLHQGEGNCDSPTALAEKVILYMERKGYLDA